MSSHKNFLQFGTLALVLLCVSLIYPEYVFAAPAGAAATMPTGIEAGIAAVISKIIGFLNILVWVLFIFLNYVLDPQFIFELDGNGAMMDMLNKIWRLSRDLMNIGFALILVGTAIYTVVTANKEFVTSHAKKFLMAIVLINFSWFFPRVIIDVANVATATIYGIPSLLLDSSVTGQTCNYTSSLQENSSCILQGAPDPDPDEPRIYKCDCMAVTDARIFMNNATRIKLQGEGWTCQADIICIQTVPWSSSMVSGHSAILNGLIINHAHLQSMAAVPGPVDSSDIGQMTQFLMVEGIILLIHLALFFPLLAMFVAFLIRIPILWLTMAFMPFIFLNWVMEGNELAGTTKRIWDEFIKAAFLPAMIAVPLSVGFILVNAGDSISGSSLGAIKIRLIDSVSNYWELLWWLMTLGVLWVGTFAVFEKAGGLYAKTANTIKSYGQAWGSLALKAPLALPIIPGLKMTPLAAMRTFNPRAIEAGISGQQGWKGFIDDLKNGGGGALGNNDLAATLAKPGEEEKLNKLHDDLVKLQQIMADPAKTQAERDTAVSKIKSDHNLDLSGNTAQKLDEFVKKLKTNNLAAPEQVKFEKIVTDMKTKTVGPAAPPVPPAPPGT